MKHKYDIFLICPVRNATEDQKNFIRGYIDGLEAQGKRVYYPARDTNQEDHVGWNICTDNKNAIHDSQEVRIFWDQDSIGSIFDLGVAFAFEKDLRIININDVSSTETKSFTNLIKYWNSINQGELNG